MSPQTLSLEKTDVLSDHEVCSRPEWLIVVKEPLNRERELIRLRDHLGVDCLLRSGFRLVGLVGIPLIAIVYLILQFHKGPPSSLRYSLLNAVISLLLNVGSSALLKAFWFLMSLLGASRWLTSREQLQ